MVGQHIILRSKSQLQFVLITHDISPRGKSEVLRKLKHYPVIQHFRTKDIEKHFDLQGVKLLGFRKSGLAKSVYAELKKYRINEPHHPVKTEEEDSPPVEADTAPIRRSPPRKAVGKKTTHQKRPRSHGTKSPSPATPRRSRTPRKPR